MLLLRAGIITAPQASPSAVAQTLQISVVGEARAEHAALLDLQASAREGRCGSLPVWVHVPAGHELVPVDAVLAHATQSARVSHA